jgi:hypothetical protein
LLYFGLRDVRRSGFAELALADKYSDLKPKTVIEEMVDVKQILLQNHVGEGVGGGGVEFT